MRHGPPLQPPVVCTIVQSLEKKSGSMSNLEPDANADSESDAKANWSAEDDDNLNLNLALKMSLMTLAPEVEEEEEDTAEDVSGWLIPSSDDDSEMPGLMLSSSDDESDGSDSEVSFNLIINNTTSSKSSMNSMKDFCGCNFNFCCVCRRAVARQCDVDAKGRAKRAHA